jgi:hypothetical protein
MHQTLPKMTPSTEPSKQQHRGRWLVIGGAATLSSVALLFCSNKFLLRDTDLNLSRVQLAVHTDDAAEPANAVCKLEFVEYISSEWETQWAKNADKFVLSIIIHLNIAPMTIIK